MLQAVIRKKINIYKEPIRKAIQKEDTLTSSIFGLLRYLPTEIFWCILTYAAGEDNLPNYSTCEAIEKTEFWPKWPPEGTNNKSHVEPDVFFRFSKFDLIIEAKRWERTSQDGGQLSNEIKSYLNNYKDECKGVKSSLDSFASHPSATQGFSAAFYLRTIVSPFSR